MNKLAILAVSFFMCLLASCSSEDNGSPTADSAPAEALAPHIVADDTSLLPRQGRRIQINSDDPNLSKEDCSALISHYRNRGAPDGQVSVHKPNKNLDGLLNPWCVENFDGTGIVFNDFFFESSDVQEKAVTGAVSDEAVEYQLDLKLDKTSADTVKVTVNSNLPDQSIILLTAIRIYSEQGESTEYGGTLYEEEVPLASGGFEREFKVDDSIWIAEREGRKDQLTALGLWRPIDNVSDNVSVRAMFSTNRDQPADVLNVLGGRPGSRMSGTQVERAGKGKVISAEKEVQIAVNR